MNLSENPNKEDYCYKFIKIIGYKSIQKRLLEIEQFKEVSHGKCTQIPGAFGMTDETEAAIIDILNDTVMNQIDTALKGILTFWLPPGERVPVHIDDQTEWSVKTSLNLPVINCDDTVYSWYDGVCTEFVRHDHGVEYWTAKEENMSHICSTIINKPAVVRTDILHGTINNGNKARLLIACRFNTDNYHIKWNQ